MYLEILKRKIRIELLTNRGKDNQRIVNKLIREVRILENQI